ncbi:MAG: cytochrome c [Oceanicoccus sp.]|uniref:c-type cytochrome n=1 Tax=Oceanicoccus sp. TaxID=2691044 RepID=UPI00262A0F8C|nr:c-type cytochrome [Oceanicoccus sp.]MCP3906891.1 cytochrome c [Oceanicoccus sp.]MDG1773414.1 c-type cytochrome [Oceanicoccus sp.]
MKKLLVGFLVIAGFTGFAQAGGNAAAGKNKAATCVACHGEGGNSIVPTFPKLAGQNERYLVKQLKDIQCGYLSAQEQKAQKCNGRAVPTMAGQLDNFNDADLADIAAYYASQAASGGQAKAANAAKGEEIYRAGIRSKGVAACTACHSPTGKGNAPAGYPALGGQYADYIAAQLRAFRAAADGLPGRANDGDTKIMRDVAYRMSDSEIDAVASYISGLY